MHPHPALWLGLNLDGARLSVALIGATSAGGVHVLGTETDALHGRDGELAEGLLTTTRAWLRQYPDIESVGLSLPTMAPLGSASGGAATWVDPLRQAIDRPVQPIDDGQAFTLAEAWTGVANKSGTVVGVLINASIRSGLVIDGRVHQGRGLVAGALGHQTIRADGPECSCGNRGCVEALASTRVAVHDAGLSDLRQTYRAALAGDLRAAQAIDAAMDHMAMALANCYLMLGPDLIVLGGEAPREMGTAILAPLTAKIERRVLLSSPGDVMVTLGRVGPAAGAIGAGLWACGLAQTPTGHPRHAQLVSMGAPARGHPSRTERNRDRPCWPQHEH